ncbi:hypothetical protein OPT61_g53 [Boeremia exigua]|uniref:Uncharacterized protein n=1 Tax=Boeremia exigua TaxID=749465 RepID=A0ACC2IV86_9PLEO|nr:hypothetical protein OPT61_g53 [Boeremia exigua]
MAASSTSPTERLPLLTTQSRYARVLDIAPWIPEVDPLHPRARTARVKLHQRHTMLIIQATLSTVFATVALAVMVWAVIHFPIEDDTGTIYTGSCRTVHYADGLWHVVLNVASTLFLGAGNYCMQVLVAPSRKDVDKAHKEGASMDIGIHCFRNVWRMSYTKRALWILLGVTSTTMHLFWNSAIFFSIPYTIYPIAIVTNDFQQDPKNWNVQDTAIHHCRIENRHSIYELKDKARDFTRLSNRECIENHIDPRHASAELILVSDVSYRDHHNRLLINAWENGYDHYTWNYEYNWICHGLRHGPNADTTDWTACTKDWILPHDGEPSSWMVYDSKIEYCLQGKSANNEERCGLHFSRTIFVIVAICLIVEAGLISSMAHIGKIPTMVTLGDAQADFLEYPGQLTQADDKIQQRSGKPARRRYCAQLCIAEWKPTNRFKLTAVGPKMWIGTVIAIVLAIALGLGLFSMSLIALKHTRFMTTSMTKSSLSPHKKRTPNRKTLRVSSYVGLQRTSYMLSLPLSYAAPMMLAFTVLHTLVARSVFLVRTAAYGPGPDGGRMGHRDASRVGYSSMGILLSKITGGIILLSFLLNSFRRFYGVPKHLPRMGNKTAFISAACQRPAGDSEAYLFPVTLMAIDPDPDGTGTRQPVRRWVFSTDRDAEPPEIGEQVEQPMPTDQHDDWDSMKEVLNRIVRPLGEVLRGRILYAKVKQATS